MVLLTVKYDTTAHYVEMDPEKTILELKNEVANLIGVRAANFDLRMSNISCINKKQIKHFIKESTNFAVVNVVISVTVVLNGWNYPFVIERSRSVRDFIREVMEGTRQSGGLFLYYNGELLDVNGTLWTNGVTEGAYLTAVSDDSIIRHEQTYSGPNARRPRATSNNETTIKYKVIRGDKSYSVNIDRSKTILQLKEIISQQTGLSIDMFGLTLNNLQLTNENETLMDKSNGSIFTVVNVRINVIVIIDGKECSFNVDETTSIDNFKNELIEGSRISSDVYFFYNNKELFGQSSLTKSGVCNNSVLMTASRTKAISAKQRLTVTYRGAHYPIEIESEKSVLDLKEVISAKSGIDSPNFTLQFYWLILHDTQPISEYIKYGDRLEMKNVIINVIVRLDDRSYSFSVNENMGINEFKKLVLLRLKVGYISLSVVGNLLDGYKTLLSSQVENNSTILAVAVLAGGW